MSTGGQTGAITLTGGVETLTITGARPGAELAISRVDAGEQPIVTLLADEVGNAHLAFVPAEHSVLSERSELIAALRTGNTVAPGEYRVVDQSASPPVDCGTVRVLALSDVPDPSLYDQAVPEGFGYIRTRDGTRLSAMVRFPIEALYGPPPYPTVIEYSGYGPSNPDEPQPGTLLANLMGFATVGVNMRGTGCSGGVFDVFSPAQAADGYDVVESVARQPWVQHHHVGMVGLSYPGISQLYVAAARPPHLAAITPLSVIDDLWRQQWPGGTYNSGFTRAWLAMRDAETQVGGQAWDQARIDAGDETAAENQLIRSQNFDFESFGRAVEFFSPAMEQRRAASFVDRIDVPVYLTGSWQDEQTGSRFALMLGDFASSPDARFTVMNGHHPDGYSPMVILRWFEFLSFHVARRIPKVNEMVRQLAPSQFQEVFGYEPEFEPDRFDHFGDDFAAAFDAYAAEPRVRILFENGAGHEVLGATAHRYETSVESFPPPGIESRRWWLEPGGGLGSKAPADTHVDWYLDDHEAGDLAYSGELLDDLNRFTQPDVPITWTRFSDEHSATYETAPFDQPLTIAGSGHVALWLKPGSADTSVQVTLTEIRPDGLEQRLQSGWHRPAHRAEDPVLSDELHVDYTFRPEDHMLLEPGEWVDFRVPIYPVTHVLRVGSRLRLQISTPGRDHPFWCFDNPTVAGARHGVGVGGTHASALVLPVWVQGVPHPEDHPPAGSLRGQPVRDAEPIRNH